MSGLTAEQIERVHACHATTINPLGRDCPMCKTDYLPVVAALIAEAVEQARAEVAAELDQRADEVYPEDIFPKPSSDYYAEVNALLKRELGHQLDRIAADCYRRALRGAASAIRDHEVTP